MNKAIRVTRAKISKSAFDYSLDFSQVDFRRWPELYCVGKGEQGVLLVEPYKSEILPYWKFRTPAIAEVSAKKIYQLFRSYLKQGDFVGMDMARKFLQMGYTRSRRYANHASGKKYVTVAATKKPASKRRMLPQAQDWATNEKAESARIFYEYYLKAKNTAKYQELRKIHQGKYG